MTSSSGAKKVAVPATARIADSSGAMYTAPLVEARARSASSHGRKPVGTPDRVSGVLAVRMRLRSGIGSF